MNYYKIYQIDDMTWRLEDCFRGYIYLLEGEKSAILIDTGFGLPNLNILVKQLTNKPITVLNTHGHGDHIGGNDQFQDCRMMECDREVALSHMKKDYRKKILSSLVDEFSLQMNEQFIDELVDTKNIDTFRPLENNEIFDLGGRTLEVIAVPGHTPGSICILDHERKNLFSADTVCDQGVLLFFDHSMPVSDFLESIQRLQLRQNEYERMWPGHHICPLNKDFLKRYETCAATILTDPKKGEEIETNIGRGRIYSHMGISIAYNEKKV